VGPKDLFKEILIKHIHLEGLLSVEIDNFRYLKRVSQKITTFTYVNMDHMLHE
jgi:hypothetical protein